VLHTKTVSEGRTSITCVGPQVCNIYHHTYISLWMQPQGTPMDLNIASALWFAARGRGRRLGEGGGEERGVEEGVLRYAGAWRGRARPDPTAR
jgi:hypothetical protein